MPHRPANGLALTQNSNWNTLFSGATQCWLLPRLFLFLSVRSSQGVPLVCSFSFENSLFQKLLPPKDWGFIHSDSQEPAIQPVGEQDDCQWQVMKIENIMLKQGEAPLASRKVWGISGQEQLFLKVSLCYSEFRASPLDQKKKKFYWRILLCTYIWTVREHFCLWSQLNQSLGIFIWLCSIATFPMISRWQFTWGWPHTSCAQKWGGTSIQTAQVFKFSDKWDLFSKHS